jgi:hypothetical protein
MRKAILGLLALLLAGSGPALAQAPAVKGQTPPGSAAEELGMPGLADPPKMPASGAGAPLMGTDLVPGAGMWYEDEPKTSASSSQRGHSKWGHRQETPLLQPGDPLTYSDHGHESEIPDQAPPGGCVYGTVDALYWWMRRGGTPVLATSGTAANPLAVPLIKDNGFDDQERMGVRASMGFWLDHAQTLAFEFGGLDIFQRAPSATLATGGDPPLARPFFNVFTGTPAADLLASPGTQSGAIAVRDLTRLWGVEANFRKELLRGCYYHLDALLGFRYLRFDEGLDITDETTFLPGSPFAGTSTVTSDRFGTHNAFWGGQLGLETEIHAACFDIDFWGKIGLGTNFEVVNINGTAITLNPDGTTTGVGSGLYAQPTNIGHHSASQFAVLPEFGVNVGYQFSSHWRATVGYTFLYLSRVVRPGEQIDQTITPPLGGAAGPAPGVTHPALLFHQNDLWMQGISAGLEYRF